MFRPSVVLESHYHLLALNTLFCRDSSHGWKEPWLFLVEVPGWCWTQSPGMFKQPTGHQRVTKPIPPVPGQETQWAGTAKGRYIQSAAHFQQRGNSLSVGVKWIPCWPCWLVGSFNPQRPLSLAGRTLLRMSGIIDEWDECAPCMVGSTWKPTSSSCFAQHESNGQLATPAPKLAAEFQDRLSAKWSWAQRRTTHLVHLKCQKQCDLLSLVNLGVCWTTSNAYSRSTFTTLYLDPWDYFQKSIPKPPLQTSLPFTALLLLRNTAVGIKLGLAQGRQLQS